MEIIAILVIGIPLALAVWLVVRAVQSRQRIEELARRQTFLERDLAELKARLVPAAKPVAGETTPAAPPASASASFAAASARVDEVRQRFEKAQAAPPLPPQPEHREAAAGRPPALPPLIGPASPPIATGTREPSFFDKLSSGSINWEQFMGVKLFAWLGGFALFLGVVFFVKYAFDHNLIPPEVRVAVGFLTGVGLLVGGTLLQRKKPYMIAAQSLCATGVVILYATTYAARVSYKLLAWPGTWWDALPAFAIMVLITATGFLLAVRLNALVVAILGICGGFLTPVLISTGEDNPLGLFGYIALLDVGLIAVALKKRWDFLTLLGAVGTALLQAGWLNQFFEREKYFEGDRILIALAAFFAFSALFTAAWAWAQRRDRGNPWLTAATILPSAAALIFGFYLMDFASVGHRPGVVFGYVLLVDLCLLALVWLDEKLAAVQLAAGAAVFLLLTVWTFEHLSNELLNWALGLCFVFALLHSGLPFVLQHRRPGTTPVWWGQLFPPVALLLLIAPIFKLESVSLILWPFVLLLDLLVIVLAVLGASVAWILAALVLTVLAAACWIGQAPADLNELPAELVVIGGFAVVFFAAGVFAARRLAGDANEQSASGGPADSLPKSVLPTGIPVEVLRSQVPACSVVLPFLLLILVTMRLPLADPSPVFGLALLLVVLLLGLTRLFPLSWLPVVGLGCVLALEHTWHFHHFKSDAAVTPLLWHLGFTLLFAGFPFLFWRQLASRVVPWATAALAGPLHFYLVHHLVKAAWPNNYMGLLPAAFALPLVAALVFLIRALANDEPKRLTLLAWFGGAALFFITLIFPIQFDRQWITIGWALEGAALLWLFQRVPRPGLRLAGLALLVTAFVRLALNPSVLEYHPRAVAAVFNWYFYAYGLTTACLFAGARLLAPPRHRVFEINARAVLNTLGTILAFLLLNVEIADYFTAPGASALTFQFSGDFARDMTYTIAWGVFALGLVIAGIARNIPASRWAGIILLCVTLLKLFLSDLKSLGGLYRIGAFIGVAVTAFVASILYQRFLAAGGKKCETKPEPKPPTP